MKPGHKKVKVTARGKTARRRGVPRVVRKQIEIIARGERSVAIGGTVTNSFIQTGNTIIYRHDSVPLNHPVALPKALPPAVPDFVGREDKIEALTDALRPGESVRLAAICGPPGVGKTELARKVGEGLIDAYPDAQVYLSLSGHDADEREALLKCIRCLDPSTALLPHDLDELSSIYQTLLDGRRVLIVLDNVARSAQLKRLMPKKGCALLVTSRNAGIKLDGMPRFVLGPLQPLDASALLRKMCRRILAGIAERICALCGHLPLAVRNAGWLLLDNKALDPALYAEELADERLRLKRLQTEEWEIGVLASFNLSYRHLKAETARFFRRLSVFPASFDDKAAIAVGDGSAGHLFILKSLGLVSWDETFGGYYLHDLLRLYAANLTTVKEKESASRRHAVHYLEFARDIYTGCPRGVASTRNVVKRFDQEWANLQAGQGWAQANMKTRQEARLCIAYTEAFIHLLFLRRTPSEQIGWLTSALDAKRFMGNQTHEDKYLRYLGIAYHNQGDLNQAENYYQQALKRAWHHGHRQVEAEVLGNLGNVMEGRRELAQALKFYQDSLAVFNEIGDPLGKASTLNNMANVHAKRGDEQKATELYLEALPLSRRLNDSHGMANILNNIAISFRKRGDTKEAIKYYRQCCEALRDIGDRRGEASVLHNLGNTLADQGKLEQAINHYDRALKILREIGDFQGQALLLDSMGNVYDEGRKYKLAIESYQELLRISREVKDRHLECRASESLGHVYYLYGDYRQAILYHEEALALVYKADDLHDRANILWNISLTCEKLDRIDKAISYMERALPLLTRIGDPRVEEGRAKLSKWRQS